MVHFYPHDDKFLKHTSADIAESVNSFRQKLSYAAICEFVSPKGELRRLKQNDHFPTLDFDFPGETLEDLYVIPTGL